MLTQSHRPRRIFLTAWLGAFLAWNTHHCVDVTVVGEVDVLLNWVAELLNEPDRRKDLFGGRTRLVYHRYFLLILFRHYSNF